jgi:enediyne biosynthesis protein E4
LSFTRRGFLKSLSRTAVVLSLEDVLKLARPVFGQQASQAPKGSARPAYEAPPRAAPKGTPSPVTGTPLGVKFVDVAKEAGLNVEMIFGGEHLNKYLLETTGCGAAFFDFDQDDWVDILSVASSRTIATAHSPTLR